MGVSLNCSFENDREGEKLVEREGAKTRYKDWQIRHGKFYEDGKWKFLKIGKPLRVFSDAAQCEQLIADLDILKEKNYEVLELNCYWHQFDDDGDGEIDRPIEPLRKLVDAIYEKGMIPCISVETYGVGGGQIPNGFWQKYPDALAVNSDGKKIKDDEYGTGAKVPSVFSPDYLAATRRYIKNIARAVDTRKVLYFETTVEPQYMGKYNLCYSDHARKAYEKWLDENGIDGPGWPEEFPIPESFRTNDVWNRFRAEFLAEWINGDAAAFREFAGEDAYIAVDYLETGGNDMTNRLGNREVFLRNLTSANIIQINWHWHFPTNKPNQIAYDTVRKIMKERGRDWAITEHMTFNGSDYNAQQAPTLLRNTIAQSTRFGWEFVSVSASTKSSFAAYLDDWSPRPHIAVVEDNWEQWMNEIKFAELADLHGP